MPKQMIHKMRGAVPTPAMEQWVGMDGKTVFHELLKLIFSGQNQFASGGLLLMLIGSIGVFLRSLPTRLWAWIVGQCTMTITVKDDDAAFTLGQGMVH